MTTAEKTETLDTVRYVIDPERTRQFGRSPDALLVSRRCYMCASRYEDIVKAGDTPPSPEEQLEEIAECCSKQADFISTEMPILEIVFRMLLAEGNRPMSVYELHDTLADRWATPANPRHIGPEALWRIMRRDTYYGFKEVAE